MTFDPIILNNIIVIATAFAAAFIILLWLSLAIWTYRDVSTRVREPLSRILAVLVVIALFLPGILIYLILRPRQTIEEEYQKSLEEEALLRSIEDVELCPGCGRHVGKDWIVCPSCSTGLGKTCINCDHLLEISWNVCPYCGAANPDTFNEIIPNSDASADADPV